MSRLAYLLSRVLPFTGTHWPVAGGALFDFWIATGQVRNVFFSAAFVAGYLPFAERIQPPRWRLLR